ncbi:hypothetical protein ACLF85_04590, partial [Helicobacter pylori]
LCFSPIRTELYYGGFLSEDNDEIIFVMDYYLSVMKNKELKRREKVLETFSITKNLRMNYEADDIESILRTISEF